MYVFLTTMMMSRDDFKKLWILMAYLLIQEIDTEYQLC